MLNYRFRFARIDYGAGSHYRELRQKSDIDLEIRGRKARRHVEIDTKTRG